MMTWLVVAACVAAAALSSWETVGERLNSMREDR